MKKEAYEENNKRSGACSSPAKAFCRSYGKREKEKRKKKKPHPQTVGSVPHHSPFPMACWAGRERMWSAPWRPEQYISRTKPVQLPADQSSFLVRGLLEGAESSINVALHSIKKGLRAV